MRAYQYPRLSLQTKNKVANSNTRLAESSQEHNERRSPADEGRWRRNTHHQALLALKMLAQ